LEIQVDGKFGPGTETALKQWQQENGLEVDGIAGRNTYRALGLVA
jgi:peptidoglycan hydrolase-like protein with peptidoglycan-binding domain